jgi:hypothetical protein
VKQILISYLAGAVIVFSPVAAIKANSAQAVTRLQEVAFVRVVIQVRRVTSKLNEIHLNDDAMAAHGDFEAPKAAGDLDSKVESLLAEAAVRQEIPRCLMLSNSMQLY